MDLTPEERDGLCAIIRIQELPPLPIDHRTQKAVAAYVQRLWLELEEAKKDIVLLARAITSEKNAGFPDWLLMQDVSSRFMQAPSKMLDRDIENANDVRLALLWSEDMLTADKEDRP